MLFFLNNSEKKCRQNLSPISQKYVRPEMSHLRGCSTSHSGGPSQGWVVHSQEMKLRILLTKVTADFLMPTKAGIGIDLARIPTTLTYEQALAAFRNEVNRKFPPQMSSTIQARCNINEVGRGRGRGGRFGRGQQGGRDRGGRGGRGNNRNRPQKTRNDSTYITLQDGQEIEYHASFHFAPPIFNKMKEADRDQMQRERKEYNRQKGQNQDQSRQIQELQQQPIERRSQCSTTTCANRQHLRWVRIPNQSSH
jgi:hypothetical protein